MKLSKQCKLVLQHIRQHGYITPLVAKNYGIDRLASRIFDLKTFGFDIVTEMHRDMAGKRYTRYALRQEAFNLSLAA